MRVEGAVHFLQTVRPESLVGSVVGMVEDKRGEVQINLLVNRCVRVSIDEREVDMEFPVDLAIRFASLLRCVVHQNEWYGANVEITTHSAISVASVVKKGLCLTLSRSLIKVREDREHDQIILKLGNEIALEASNLMFLLIGQSMAQTAEEMS